MTDGAPQRPNSNYKLSKPDDMPIPVTDEGLNFRYNRDHRLAKAPQSVQDLYKEQKPFRFNLFGPLLADRPRRALFFVIIFLCAVIFALSKFGYLDSSYSIDGNKLDITGIEVEGTTIVTVKKKANNDRAYTGAVDVAVSVPMPLSDSGSPSAEGDYPVFYHRLFFTLRKEEQPRFTVPFTSPELLMVIQTEKSTLQLKFQPE